MPTSVKCVANSVITKGRTVSIELWSTAPTAPKRIVIRIREPDHSIDSDIIIEPEEFLRMAEAIADQILEERRNRHG